VPALLPSISVVKGHRGILPRQLELAKAQYVVLLCSLRQQGHSPPTEKENVVGKGKQLRKVMHISLETAKSTQEKLEVTCKKI